MKYKNDQQQHYGNTFVNSKQTEMKQLCNKQLFIIKNKYKKKPCFSSVFLPSVQGMIPTNKQ